MRPAAHQFQLHRPLGLPQKADQCLCSPSLQGRARLEVHHQIMTATLRLKCTSLRLHSVVYSEVCLASCILHFPFIHQHLEVTQPPNIFPAAQLNRARQGVCGSSPSCCAPEHRPQDWRSSGKLRSAEAAPVPLWLVASPQPLSRPAPSAFFLRQPECVGHAHLKTQPFD